MAKGMGLMGEAGAEAIMPLKRNSQGKLGVVASGSIIKAIQKEVVAHITMNINAVDSRSFVEMMRTNKAGIESIVVENIMKNGAVKKCDKGDGVMATFTTTPLYAYQRGINHNVLVTEFEWERAAEI